MTVVKIIEIMSEGKTIEEAVESAIKHASHTIKDIHQIDIEHIHAKVENNKVTKYRLDTKISFVIHPSST